jgi:hypothetical protein
MYDALLDKGLHPDGILLVDSMAALMQTGTWNHEAVVNLAESAFMSEKTTSGRVENWSAIYQALARNPRAAAEFMDAHPDEIWDQAQYGSPPYYEEDYDAAFAAFVRAATVDAHSIYARMGLHDDDVPNLAEQNAAFLITSVAELDYQPLFSDELRSTFADVSEKYWDEFMQVFSSPAGVAEYPENGPPPIDGIDPEHWNSFMLESMRAEEGAAKLFELFHTQTEETDSSRSGDHNASGWTGYVNGRLKDMFLNNWNTVLEERDASAEEAKEFRDGVIDLLIDTAFDPKGTAEKLSELPADVAKEILGDLAKGWMDSLVEDENLELNTDVFSYHQSWMNYANARIEHEELPYLSDDVEPYEHNGVTWDGNPARYEDKHDASFTDEDGKILPLSTIKKDPAALAAYNEWLQDPAVQRATNGFFQDENLPG